MKNKTKSPELIFEEKNTEEILRQKNNVSLRKESLAFYLRCSSTNYSYHFKWLGRPIIQCPQDIVAVQELIWEIRPDCIIETGIAHGGSLILSSSMIELLRNKGVVIGVDIDIRKHNKKAILKHPLYKNIRMIEGSSTDPGVVSTVKAIAKKYKKILVLLDSNHTGDHVFQELQLYAPLVSKGSYIVAFDTIVEYMPKRLCIGKPWSKGNNPYTAVQKFLKSNKDFRVDEMIESKLLLTSAPGGFLKRIR